MTAAGDPPSGGAPPPGRARRYARALASSFVLSVVTVDVAAAALVGIFGAFYGYGRTVSAVWTWRSEHVAESLLMALVLLAIVRGLRLWLARDGREPGRVLCRVGIHRWESREGLSRGWWETWNRCKRTECHYSAWMRVAAEQGDREEVRS